MSTSATPFGLSIRVPDFPICWAGPNPFGDGFCFGSDDGRICFTDDDGSRLVGPWQVSPCREAVNGIAGVDGVIGVSTRADVTFLRPYGTDGAWRGTVRAGSHGLTTTSDGWFVGPMGPTGVMFVKPDAEQLPVTVVGPPHDAATLPYYHAVTVGQSGGEVMVFAARTRGVVFTPYSGGPRGTRLRTSAFEGLDVVDVCATGTGPGGRGLAAITRDGTVLLYGDVSGSGRPETVKFAGVDGPAYRVLSARGHLFILTSSGLHILLDVLIRAEAGAGVLGFSHPLAAVDANLCGDKYLLVVIDDDRVIRFDVSMIRDSTEATGESNGVHLFDGVALYPEWEENSVEHESQSLQFA